MKRVVVGGREPVEPEPGLLAARVLGEHADLLAEVRVRADQRELRVARRGVHRRPQRAVELVDAGEAVGPPRLLGHPRRVLVERAEARHERLASSSIRPLSASGTSSKASTSTSPRSVIFSDGITDSARNESVMNGASIVDALLDQQVLQALEPFGDLLQRAVGEQPGDRQRELAAHLAVARDDQPAAERLRPRGAQRHVARRTTPTTTRLCASWATVEANAPAVQPEPAHEPEPDAAGAVVALDHGDLGQVARRVGDDVPVDDQRRLAPARR